MASSTSQRVHVSTHPIVKAKLSQLRSKNCDARATNRLIHELASIVCCEALSSCLTVENKGQVGLDKTLTTSINSLQDETPLGHTYNVESISPSYISVIPILRSGLGMVEAIQNLLPDAVSIHHLGLFREPVSLQPVEYYNNLPDHSEQPSASSSEHLAIILDPIIATGGTAIAAIQTLRDWGVSRIVIISILGSEPGVLKAVEEWDSVEVWIAGLDSKLNDKGMIIPGVGDVGDRLFGTKGK